MRGIPHLGRFPWYQGFSRIRNSLTQRSFSHIRSSSRIRGFPWIQNSPGFRLLLHPAFANIRCFPKPEASPTSKASRGLRLLPLPRLVAVSDFSHLRDSSHLSFLPPSTHIPSLRQLQPSTTTKAPTIPHAALNGFYRGGVTYLDIHHMPANCHPHPVDQS
jgi:hypothetical protein